jgi:hypothetical protein
MLGEIIGTDWLTRRRSEDQVTGLWIQILRTHFSVQITKKGNNPALQLDWTTASRTFGKVTPSQIQPARHRGGAIGRLPIRLYDCF